MLVTTAHDWVAVHNIALLTSGCDLQCAKVSRWVWSVATQRNTDCFRGWERSGRGQSLSAYNTKMAEPEQRS